MVHEIDQNIEELSQLYAYCEVLTSLLKRCDISLLAYRLEMIGLGF
jgi:hypothetical protein